MIGVVTLLGLLLQAPPAADTARRGSATQPPSAVAVRAARPPVIDGRDDDPVWRDAPAITQFLEFSPTEGKAARFPTEARVAYDAAHLYVFVRCFDPHPDSILRLLARRDTYQMSDGVVLIVDSYHDRRTGYEFGVNASGVKYDAAVYNDGNEDGAWDAVWDVATRVDSLGWTAEFRIPLSQLRYGPQVKHTFGIAIVRDLYRYRERISWPLFRQSAAGLISQLAEIGGFDSLEAPRRLEAAPYVVTKNVSHVSGSRIAREQDVTAGADLKYRVAPNLTLDATVNPDFGQVEADPAVLNLTAYETFFPERRPFFVAGSGLFRMDINCNDVSCSNEGMFYTRRIGRAPSLAGVHGDTTSPAFTTILGAAKLTGRLAGLRIGALDAVTGKMTGVGGVTIEPAANYAVLRLEQDYLKGEGSVGGMATAVNRSLDSSSTPYLPGSSYAGALGFRQRFLAHTYEVSGLVAASRVAGSANVMREVQRSSVHYFQRPDADLGYDTTRTMLTGDAEELKLDKVAGRHIEGETAYQRRSPGFEINDLGYLQRAGQQSWSTWVGLYDRKPNRYYRSLQWNWNWWEQWTTWGLLTQRAVNTNLHITLPNNWNFSIGNTWGQLGATYCDGCARGGPAVRQDPYISPSLGIGGDDRKPLVAYLNVNYSAGGAGRGNFLTVSPELDLKLSTRFTSSAYVSWSHNANDYQWYGSFTDSAGGNHYTFARLRQTTVSLTARLNYTITRDVSLQVYAQPFDSKGTYSNVRELSSTPRAARFDDRYQPYADPSVANNPGGFNYRQFRSSVVFRWEYRAGSTLFLVWTQGRQGSVGEEGTESVGGDLRELLRLRPDNSFLVKLSYWLNP